MSEVEHDLFEAAWGLIASAYEGDWSSAPAEWREAAERWRDTFYEVVVPQWTPGRRLPENPPSVDGPVSRGELVKSLGRLTVELVELLGELSAEGGERRRVIEALGAEKRWRCHDPEDDCTPHSPLMEWHIESGCGYVWVVDDEA